MLVKLNVCIPCCELDSHLSFVDVTFLQSSIDKTAPNLQRRILKLMKNPQSQMTVKICTTECIHDEVCTEHMY